VDDLKQLVHHICQESIQQKIDLIRQSIADTQASANEETKSSAGDKYETGRAMAQLEIEKFSSQLVILQQQLQELARVGQHFTSGVVSIGSLVHTSLGVFYLATNAGDLIADGKKIFAISPKAPIAQKLVGRKAGESIEMNGRTIQVLAVD